MIAKELDPFNSDDKFRKAGHEAEKQMAFYLKREFAKQPDIHVLNNIRLEYDNDAAQIDHLVIHQWGFVIIESKSIKSGEIEIKDDGQWIRWYGNKPTGMASALNQAELQKRFLQEFMMASSSKPEAIKTIPIQITVAISDTGKITWPKSGQIPGIYKADQIAGEINKIIAEETHRQKGRSILDLPGIQKLSDYLIKVHNPLEKQNVVEQKQAKYTAPETSIKQCKFCQSSNLEIKNGHNYYFRCLDCNKNTAIKYPFCEKCNRTMEFHKNKKDYRIECAHCNTSELFYSNK